MSKHKYIRADCGPAFTQPKGLYGPLTSLRTLLASNVRLPTNCNLPLRRRSRKGCDWVHRCVGACAWSLRCVNVGPESALKA